MTETLVLAGSTWRSALRTPAPWVLALLGACAVWAGAALDVLAIEDVGDRTSLGWSTAEGIAVLACLVVVTRTLAEDRTSGLAATLGAGPLGVLGHLSARCLGGVLIGLSIAVLPVATSLALSNYRYVSGGSHLYSAFISHAVSILVEALLVGAWAAVFVHLLPAAAAAVAVLGAAVAGRLVSSPGLVAVLPRPLDPRGGSATPVAWVVGLAAASGLLLVATALARRLEAD